MEVKNFKPALSAVGSIAVPKVIARPVLRRTDKFSSVQTSGLGVSSPSQHHAGRIFRRPPGKPHARFPRVRINLVALCLKRVSLRKFLVHWVEFA